MNQITRPRDLRPDSDTLHIGIWAESGYGKTFLMNEIHKDSQVASVLVAQPKDEDDYNLYGQKTDSKADLKRKLENKEKIHFNPPTSGKKYLKEVNAIYEVASEVDGEVVIFLDEVHRISHVKPKDGVMSLSDMLTDGRGNGVRFMICSQDLNRFSNKTGRTVLAPLQEHIFMGINEFAKGFYNFYSFPYEEIEEKTEVQYAGVRFNFDEGLMESPFKLRA